MVIFREMETLFDLTQPRVTAGAYTDDVRPTRPDLLVVGGTGRNSGKTELVCRIIRLHAASKPVVGLKVTTVERTDGHCPHGGGGCGACSSLTRPWIVTREFNPQSPKDTCRMLASGARSVYWLRALRSELAGGAADLLAHLRPGWVGVCESTSLRQLVEPGLFLLVRDAGSDGAKPSARAVSHLADRVVESDGHSFDLELDRISVIDRQWVLRREASAVVIGDQEGFSEADHGAALLRTRASLEPQFDRVMFGSRDLAQGQVQVPPTELSGPPGEWCLVTPPLANGVPPGLVNALFRSRAGADAVVTATRPGPREGCLALCRRALLPEVIAALGWGAGAVRALSDRCKVRELRWEETGSDAGSESRRAAVVQRAVAEAR